MRDDNFGRYCSATAGEDSTVSSATERADSRLFFFFRFLLLGRDPVKACKIYDPTVQMNASKAYWLTGIVNLVRNGGLGHSPSATKAQERQPPRLQASQHSGKSGKSAAPLAASQLKIGRLLSSTRLAPPLRIRRTLDEQLTPAHVTKFSGLFLAFC